MLSTHSSAFWVSGAFNRKDLCLNTTWEFWEVSCWCCVWFDRGLFEHHQGVSGGIMLVLYVV